MYKIKINDRNYEIKTDDKNCENNKNKINDYIYEYLTEMYEIKLYKKSSQLENIDTNIVTNIVTKVSLTMGYDKFFNTINQNTNISNICTFTVTRTEHLILECISCFISCFTQIVHSNDLDKIKDEETIFGKFVYVLVNYEQLHGYHYQTFEWFLNTTIKFKKN